MSIDDKPTPNELRILELEKAIKWVVRDASYKAPEQFNVSLADRWVTHLQAALVGSTASGSVTE